MNSFRLVLVCLVVLTLSCGKPEEATDAQAEPEAAPPAAPQAAATSPPADAPPSARPSEMAVIATGESEVSGLRAEIHGLNRGTGGILTLHLSLINETDKDLDFDYNFADPEHSVPDFSGIGGIYLVDPTGMEKLGVMRDVDDRGICSRRIRSIPPGSRALLWAKFPAPAESVSHVSILIPKFLPIDDVPIGVAPAPPEPYTAGTKQVIASAIGEIGGRRIEIHQLKRGSGGVIDLRFSIINDSSEPLNFGYEYTDPNHDVADFSGVGGVHLLDPIVREKQGVIRDTENKCACSQKVKDLAPGERVDVWAKFPATTAVRVSVVLPHFLPMDDVPIQ